MFSDVVGYTAIMGRDEREGLRAVREHRAYLRSILPRFNGRLIGEVGDGTLSSFHSAMDAVNCARELQAALVEDPELRLRIGIHVGDVMFTDNTVLGDGVNIASRLNAIAAPGGVCISERVYEDISNKPEIKVKDLGEQRLKNVSRPIRAYQIVTTVAQPAEANRGRRRIALIASTGAAILAGVVVALVRLRSPARMPAPAQPQTAARHTISSIAVLPLDNLSGDPSQDYFADGMTDELITDLATISALRVISRTSVMQFKGEHRKPLPEIAKALNVDAIVEGSVVRAGGKVRISAQLIDAPTDRHLWAKSYERDSRDVLALQDEVASAIAKEVAAQLTPEERARLTTSTTINPEAHDAYLRGRYFFSRPTDENLKKAIAQFERAISLDPNFAPAYSGLADAYNWAGFNEDVFTAAEAMAKNKASAEKAVQLDNNSAEAHASLAMYLYCFEFDWQRAEREFRRSFELNPSYAFAHDQFGLALGQQGRLDEALAENKHASALDPLSAQIPLNAAWLLGWRGDFDRAKEQARLALNMDPDQSIAQFEIGWIDIQAGNYSAAIPALHKALAMKHPPTLLAWLGYAYGASGDQAKALEVLHELKTKTSPGYSAPFNQAVVYLGIGNKPRALDCLEQAYAAHSEWIGWIYMDKIARPLDSEPRFIALMKKLGLHK